METFLTEKARKQAYRNRPRFPQSRMQVAFSFKDSKGKEYVKYSNGMIETQLKALVRGAIL